MPVQNGETAKKARLPTQAVAENFSATYDSVASVSEADKKATGVEPEAEDKLATEKQIREFMNSAAMDAMRFTCVELEKDF